MEVFQDDMLEFEDDGGSDDCAAFKAALHDSQKGFYGSGHTQPSEDVLVDDVAECSQDISEREDDESSNAESEHDNE